MNLQPNQDAPPRMDAKSTKEEQLTLELLDAIGKNSDVSQRHLARQMGIALGLANSYLKRCIRKGYVKISEAPANRYLYYLTPKGFAEKGRLTANYLANSFSFYREASESCRQVLAKCQTEGWRRVLLCGQSDLAEIASLRASEVNIDIIGVFDPDSSERYFVNKPVFRSLGQAPAVDVYFLTDVSAPQASYDYLRAAADGTPVVVPDVLRVGGDRL